MLAIRYVIRNSNIDTYWLDNRFHFDMILFLLILNIYARHTWRKIKYSELKQNSCSRTSHLKLVREKVGVIKSQYSSNIAKLIVFGLCIEVLFNVIHWHLITAWFYFWELSTENRKCNQSQVIWFLHSQ